MSIEAWLLAKIAEKVFSIASEKGQGVVEQWVRDKLGLEPRKQAFKRVLDKAYKRFEKKYPQWAHDLFNASFLENEAAPVLAQFLVHDGHPNPSELAMLWATSLNIRNPERRTTLVRELEPAATDFLDWMASGLKGEEALSSLNDSRALDQVVGELKAIRKRLDAELATPGTRHDYLHWLIERNLYLDPRGTFQTQRQVQVKLVEVYIALRAQQERVPGTVDRNLLEKEMAQLEAKLASSPLPAEEREDRREHLAARLESQLAETQNRAGEVLELAEVVKRHERVVILGDPGSGKSTLLRYLALKHAQALWDGRSEAGADLGVARFPIMIRIADYAEHGLPKGRALSEFLVDYYALHECPRSGLTDLLTSELTKGNCLVLLDGLDEIVSADDRRKVVERIEDFVRHHDKHSNRFVITSRRAGYRSAPLGEPFAHSIVQDMDEGQIRRFLERWCTAVEAAQTPELSPEARQVVAQREIDAIMKAVQNVPGVRRLATNPLLLRTLALIHRTGAQLPQRRIELYKLAAETLARTWRTAQGVPESALVDDKYLTRLLGRLAYWMHEHKSTGIATEQEVYRELGKEWARIKGLDWDEDNPDIDREVKKFLLAVREHTGLFVERAPKRYGFMHLTFEEYYAARYLVARSKDRAKLIREHLHQPRWEEPILLALGFVGLDSPDDAAELLETAIMAESEEARDLGFGASPYKELLGRDFLFALRCLGDNIPAKPRILQTLIKRLVDEVLYSSGSAKYQRYQRALNERLTHLPGSEGASVLLPLFLVALHEDADADVRNWAAESLGQLGQGSSEVLAALLAALHDDANTGVRTRAAVSLGQLGQGSSEVLAALLAALQHDADALVRNRAAESLGQLGQGSSEVLAALLAALHEDANADVRTRAAESLGRLAQASPEVVAGLLAALHEDADADVRYWAAVSLGRLGHSSQELIDVLFEVLHKAQDLTLRLVGARLLGRFAQSDELTIQALQDGLLDENHNVRSACAEALVQLGRRFPDVTETIVQKLLRAIEDPKFDKLDTFQRSGHDYAYDGLWLLIVGGEISGE